jgi:hypothetical protein
MRVNKRTLGALAALAAGAALVVALASAATATTIPSSFFTVTDQQGANDVPGQVDLTQMGRDDTSSTSNYLLFWSWDSTDQWTGTGQTGDACALFDSDSDGNINLVVCGQIDNPGADPNTVLQTATSPYVFSCSDKKNDRCTNPSPVTYTSSQVQAGAIGSLSRTTNLITDTDPFATGTNYPNDSALEVSILKSFLNTTSVGTAGLVNVCSYPSAGNGGNNNPFDCIVTPGTGFLKVVKSVSGGTNQPFSFALDPAPPSPGTATYSLTPTTGSADTGSIVYPIGTVTSVTETVPPGWTLSTGSCTVEGDGSTGTFDSANHKITGIQISSGKITACTFTNAPIPPKLHLRKTVTTDNGGTAAATAWTLTATGALASPTNLSGSTPVDSGASFKADTYTLAEKDGPAGYTAGAWSCVVTGTTTPVTVTNSQVTLGLGDDVTCTINNDDNKANPAMKTAQGWRLFDTANFTGLRTGAPDRSSATVTFKLWSDSACSIQVDKSIVVTGVTSSSIPSGTGIDVTGPGTYYWTVDYSGDQYNSPTSSACGIESTTISAVQPTP